MSLVLVKHMSCYASVMSLVLVKNTSFSASVMSLVLVKHMSCYASVMSLVLVKYTSLYFILLLYDGILLQRITFELVKLVPSIVVDMSCTNAFV